MMKYYLHAGLLAIAVAVAIVYTPPARFAAKPLLISSQFNEMEFRAAVVKWKVEVAKVQVDLDGGAVTKTGADFEKATKAWKRAQQLLASRAISQADYDVARYDYIAAEVAWGGAKLTVQQDKYRVEEMTALLEQAKLFEGMAGVITRETTREYVRKP